MPDQVARSSYAATRRGVSRGVAAGGSPARPGRPAERAPPDAGAPGSIAGRSGIEYTFRRPGPGPGATRLDPFSHPDAHDRARARADRLQVRGSRPRHVRGDDGPAPAPPEADVHPARARLAGGV